MALNTPSIIALDSMIFIYVFEQSDEFLKPAKQLIKLAESGQSQIITSIVSLTESLSSPKLPNYPTAITDIQRFFRETPNLQVFPVDWSIAIVAGQLRREYKSLRTPNSIQIATAIVHQATIFYTNDKRLTSIQLPNMEIKTL